MPDEGMTRKNAEPEAVAATEIRDRLTELMNRVGYGNERIVLTMYGKPLAGLVGMDDLDKLRALDAAA